MNNYKKIILSNICFTELVYARINKKLKLNLSNEQIEKMIIKIIKETEESDFEKIGKNIYIFNKTNKVKLTINSHTNRIITANQIINSIKKFVINF